MRQNKPALHAHFSLQRQLWQMKGIDIFPLARSGGHRHGSRSDSFDICKLMPAKPANDSVQSFEEAMERLDEIVSAMEGERMPLDEMVASYEEGVKLLSLCRQRIDTARMRVEKIQVDLEKPSQATLEDFNPMGEEEERAEASSNKRVAPRKSAPVPSDADDEIRLF